ncbi:hypothetical protein [Sulfolobus spindle-shaped virus]|uniref:Regulatory protein MarR n=1 Tax=Saccharolobus islandicus (strain M.14.25 / Kamchatka \|nr:MarR family transcriptional regulator [Sulfolobus islandicus]ACP38581.1 regulatory protein MarR [Sulfolobus islandicus M.14.25]AZG03270.1 hypothetical protein [Sulfolobus spindle-shaped virus]
MSKEELVEEEEEIVQDTEELIDDTEEVAKEEELEEEEVREETIQILPKKLQRKNLLDIINDFRNSLYYIYNKEDKQLKILLLLHRKEALHVRKLEELTKTNGKYVKRYLNQLEEFGLIQSYRVNPDTRTYYKLTEKGKAIANTILYLLDLR